MADKPKPLPKPPAKADDPEQSKRFIEMAREVGASEDPEEGDRAFREVTRSRPQKPPPRANGGGRSRG